MYELSNVYLRRTYLWEGLR